MLDLGSTWAEEKINEKTIVKAESSRFFWHRRMRQKPHKSKISVGSNKLYKNAEEICVYFGLVNHGQWQGTSW